MFITFNFRVLVAIMVYSMAALFHHVAKFYYFLGVRTGNIFFIRDGVRETKDVESHVNLCEVLVIYHSNLNEMRALYADSCTYDYYGCTYDYYGCTYDYYGCTYDYYSSAHDYYSSAYDYYGCTYDYYGCTYDYYGCTYDNYGCTYDYYRYYGCTYNYHSCAS